MPARVLSLSNWRSQDRSAVRATQGAGPQQVHMFAGIVESVGKIVELGRTARRADSAGQAWCLKIELGELLDDLAPGASVAINGVCLTLTAPSGSVGAFDVIPETWRRTTLQYASVGDGVNLERSLRAGDRIDGHFVQGHVDGIGSVDRVERSGGEYKLWITPDPALLPFIIPKGSIALDGTSLTIVDVVEQRFSVALIPTTIEGTTLGKHRAGDKLNIETDILARMVVSRLEALSGQSAASPGGVSWERLRESGFVP